MSLPIPSWTSPNKHHPKTYLLEYLFWSFRPGMSLIVFLYAESNKYMAVARVVACNKIC